MKAKHIIVINGISDEGANVVSFDYKDQKITIAEYFERVYNIKLHHPNLPCVIEKKPKGKNGADNNAFYPLEVLIISEGQRVSFDKQTPKLVGY